MTNFDDESLKRKIKEEEELISSIVDDIDFSKYITQDYVDCDVELVPGRLVAKYRSPYDGELFDIEAAADEKEIPNGPLRDLYRYRRSLASGLISINGEQFMPSAGADTKVEGLKRKPKHLVDRLLWGHILFQEALRRVLSEPERLDQELKNSSGTHSTDSE